MKRPSIAKDEKVYQFIGYCKSCLRFEKLDYLKFQNVALKREIPVGFVKNLSISHSNNELENMIKVLDFKIAIKNDLFYECLIKLKKREVDILYLSACEDMSDTDISKELKLPRSTVQRVKRKTKDKIRKMMGVKDNGIK